MFSLDEGFRIRPPNNESTLSPAPKHNLAEHVDPNADLRCRPTFSATAESLPLNQDALRHRLADFDDGRRLMNASEGSGAMRPWQDARTESRATESTRKKAAQTDQRSENAVPHTKDAASVKYHSLTAEDDEGDVEYKWRLTGISTHRFEHLVTQMKFRVSEGHGQCLYELGVADNGDLRGLSQEDFTESVNTIQRMARTLGLDCTILQECVVQREPSHLYCGELLVSQRHARAQDLSLCFCGALGSGKSTLMGALLSSTLDDGHGSARQSLFNHKHEVDSGRTTSIATRVWTVSCGLPGIKTTTSEEAVDELFNGTEVEVSVVLDDGEGEPLSAAGGCRSSSDTSPRLDSQGNHPPDKEPEDFASNRESVIPTEGSLECLHSSSSDGAASSLPIASPTVQAPGEDESAFQHLTNRSPAKAGRIKKKKPRLISLMDVGGDITKTSLFGLMSRKPDYVCLCVAANSAVESVALYAQVSCAIGTPFLVVVTKTDAVEDFELDGFCMDVAATLRNNAGCVCDVVGDAQTAFEHCRKWLPLHRDGGSASCGRQPPRVPVICVSSVTGEGLELLKFTIAHLPRPRDVTPMSQVPASVQPPVEILLDYAFHVKGVGPIVRGRVASGTIEVGGACFMGPDVAGAFLPVVLRGIHVDGAHVNEAQAGDEATFALDRLPPSVDLSHKGKVLVRQPKKVASAFRLTARVLSKSLSPNLEPILYSRNARQAIRIVACHPTSSAAFPSASLETGSPTAREMECEVECAFLFRPELLTYDDPVVLRWEPNGIAVGQVSRLGPMPS